MTAPEQAPRALAQMSRHARLQLKRELAARCVELGIRVNETTSPGRLALKHDPTNSVQRPHLEAIDDVLVKMLAEPNRRQMIFTPPQIGKLVAHNTPVPTPAGWVNHGDLRPGDEVYHPSGKSVRVTAIGGDDYATMRVSTSDGGAVTVHPRHEWTVYDRNWKRWTTMETRQIAARKLTTGPVGKRGGRYVFQLPHRDPLEGVDTGLPIDPYTLGVWLGDGTSTKAAVTHHADDHYDLPYPESAQCVHRSTGVVTTYYRGGLYAELKALGVHGNKHIPASYLRASETSRRALLAGLIDSDGTIAKSGQVTFSNINKRLADGIVELVRTLGYRATVHTPLEPCTSSSGIVGKHTLYRVSFTPHDGIAPARLTRKASMSAFTATRRRTAITAIEQVAPTPGRCITVDAPDGLYLVGEHMIPTHNSTRISRWFPFWYLTERPRARIILASYAASLAVTHGAATRDLVTMYGDDYGLRLKDTEATKASWMLHTGGGMRSVGVRGGLTGQPMDCLSGDTVIHTHVGPRSIRDIVESGDHPHVLSYNHTHDRIEWRPVIATRTIHGRPLVRITTAAGRTIDCTPDHRLRTPQGYVAATDLVAGDRLTACGGTDLRPMRHTGYAQPQGGGEVDPRARGSHLLQHSLPGSEDPVHVHLQVLQDRVHPSAVRGAEDEAVGATRSAVLLTAVSPQAHADPECSQVPALRHTDPERGLSPLLLGRVPDDRTVSEPTQGPHPSGRDNHLSRVSGRVPSEDQPPRLLQQAMREQGAQSSDDRQGQLPVYDRTQLCELVPRHATTHPGTGEPSLHAVRRNPTAGHVPTSRQGSDPFADGGPPHQRGPFRQPGGEPGGAVHSLSRPASPPSADTVVSVRELHGESHTVYDLQVEGNSNFFANEVLVHNCGIIDDPVKDREQAESPVVRASVWDWYSSVWTTRKAPEAGEVLVMTRFHADDLAGRLLDQDGRVEEGGEWHVLHLPALAMAPDPDKGVYPDPLGREPGEPISHPRIDAADIGGLLAHWGRARKAVTNRDWNALYQGTPFDAEGALLSADDVRDHTAPEPETWKRNVVGVDPSGGGRDTAGIVVVGLDREGRGWFRADYTGHMTSYEWPRQACMAAVEFDAERIVVETNFGGDQATTLVAQAWDELERKGHIPAGRLCPLIASVTARKSKVLRAEPIAQAIKTGRLWFAQGADLKQLTDEWLMWEPGTTWSPGALDAGVYGATEVLPPLPRGAGLANPAKMSRGSAAPIGVAGRRIARR